ncbi:sigma-54-dependent transcriptional regulator [Nitrincola sp. MINF-07-Sa-05]|uniref:sigma-54-dependent transcriptional regulator n=1 Tax=Nitrincola salilacus TaxID=3400273 RepID=UPI003917F455
MTSLPKILLVDDDACVLETFVEMLELEDFSTQCFSSASGVLAYLQQDPNAIVLTDVCMPGQDGLQLLSHLQDFDAELPVILMSGHGDIPMATQAMREGAVDFLEKPVPPKLLIERLRQAQRHRQWALARREQRLDGDDRAILEQQLIGQSAQIRQLHDQIMVLANAGVDTLIYGETGSGKDVVARALHDVSPRRNKRFMAINCGAMPENLIESELFGHEPGAFTGATHRQIGKIEAADGGTLFLDEIETMPLTAQIRLLRVLQERSLERLGSTRSIKVDIRVIAASKSELQQLSEQGHFRQDLYYRLNVASLQVPPLKARGDDILLLFQHYCHHASIRFDRPLPALRPSQRDKLLQHDWPGNVRELRNIADRFVLGLSNDGPLFWQETLAVDEEEPSLHDPFDQRLEEYERQLICECLESSGGQIGKAAEALKMSRKTLYRKMKKYQLDKGEFRD